MPNAVPFNDVGVRMKKGGWVASFQKCYEGLTPAQTSVLLWITFHIHYGSSFSYPRIKTLSKETKLSTATVQRAIKELVLKGLVLVTERYLPSDPTIRTSNAYTVMIPNSAFEDSKEPDQIDQEEEQEHIEGIHEGDYTMHDLDGVPFSHNIH